MLKNKPIKTQLIVGFLIIIIASILLTILTIVFSVTWWFRHGQDKILPANHYEKKIPHIELFIEEAGESLLNPAFKNKIENIIPEKGIKYQVLDVEGNVKYGNFDKNYINEQNPIKKNLNLKIQISNDPNHYIYYVPIFNDKAELKGAVGLNYKLKLSYSSPAPFILVVLVFLSPFIYVVLLTILLASIIGKRISKPIQELIIASNQIKNKNLNFKLNYYGDNEIGDLILAYDQMRCELKDSLFRTWNLEQEKKNYITTISHDLKTPLTIIKGHSEGLMDGIWKNQELMFKYLKTIDSTADRMSELINKINAINESEKLSTNLIFKPIKVEDYFINKMNSFKHVIESKFISFKYSIENKENTVLFSMNSEGIHQVIDNLLINSLKYTPQGGKIVVRIIIEEENLSFHVYDSGKGFNKKTIDKLFLKFYQEPSTKQFKDGTGLGMYSAKMIVEQHKGTIHAENNNEYRGAHVYFSIPNNM